MVDPGIFKAYDVRGIYGEQIDEDVAYRARARRSRACSATSRSKRAGELRVGLGRDMRLSAPALSERYADGMRDEGADVLDVGEVGTEMLYFAVGSRDLDGGLMCTASHNPKAYTGAKLVRRGALAAVRRLRDRRAEGDRDGRRARRPGGAARRLRAGGRRRGLPGGGRRRSSTPTRSAPMKVVLDGGNGMAGPMVGPLLDRLPIEQVQTYWTPDGNFPDHEPNPLLPENRRFIVEKVLSEGAELGIAWDGDADRCFFIDDTGQFVDGDFLTALLAESILDEGAGRARSSTTCAPAAPCATRSSAPAAPRSSTASATRSSRRACATRAPRSAARSRATTTSATSTAPTPARSRRC